MAAAISAQTLSVHVAPEIFNQFPDAKVAFSLIEVILKNGKKLKGAEAAYISDFKQRVVRQLMDQGVDKASFENLQVCRSWNQVFSSMKAGDGKQSTIVNLLRRAVGEIDKLKEGKKADLGKISNFVDLYNCVSLDQLTPMGAFDLSAIRGNIQLRFGQPGETFTGLGRTATTENVQDTHVVYADDASVLTWLWNYRDAAHVSVPDDSAGQRAYVLLFADQAHQGGGSVLERPGDAQAAIEAASREVANIGGRVLLTDCLSKDRPRSTLDLSHLSEGVAAIC
jgi:DNA/RNA-binding domain of Phe-tRNA-synthetase-like protein